MSSVPFLGRLLQPQPFPLVMCLLFTQCSKNCGRGTKVRDVHCVDTREQRLLRPFHCQAVLYKPPAQLPCQNTPCLDWYMSSWREVGLLAGLSGQGGNGSGCLLKVCNAGVQSSCILQALENLKAIQSTHCQVANHLLISAVVAKLLFDTGNRICVCLCVGRGISQFFSMRNQCSKCVCGSVTPFDDSCLCSARSPVVEGSRSAW